MTSIPTFIGVSPGDHGCGRTLTWLIQGAVDGGIKHITNFNTDIPDDYFTCKSPCECQ